MKKLFAAVLIMAMAVSSVAFAGYSDEYKAKYPARVKVKTEQDLSGKTVTTEEYRLFNNGKGFSLGLRKSNDYKYAYIQYFYNGKFWRFYKGFTWGDGNNIHDLNLFIDPSRTVGSGFVMEIILASVNPTELKNAIIVHAHSDKNGPEIMIGSSDPRWAEWKTALEDAEKILADK